MKIKETPLDKIIPYARNPRVHGAAVDKVAASIQEFGFRQPIVVDGDGVIVVGHARYEAARRLELERAPVHVAEGLTPAQIKAYRLADNRMGQEAKWDNELLGLELEDLKGAEFDLLLTGFEGDELEALFAGDDRQGLTGDDEIPPVEKDRPLVTQAGDLWLMGAHRLLCGDATKQSAMARLIDGQRCDLAVTSPPYNVGLKYAQYRDRQTREEYLRFIAEVGANLFRALADGRFLAWNIGVSRATYPSWHVPTLEDCGFVFYRQIVWQKTGVPYPIFPATVKTRRARKYTPNHTHEMIEVLEKPGDADSETEACAICAGSGQVPARGLIMDSTHEIAALMITGENPVLGEAIQPDKRYQNDVWKIPQTMATVDLKTVGNERSWFRHGVKTQHFVKEHPAAYPVELPSAVMRFLTAAGEAVIDPFAGVGSTLIGCEKMQRHFLGLEIDATYCDITIRRWQEYTGQAATLEGDGRSFATIAAEREKVAA